MLQLTVLNKDLIGFKKVATTKNYTREQAILTLIIPRGTTIVEHDY